VLYQATGEEIMDINIYCHKYLYSIKSKEFKNKFIKIPRVIYDLYALNLLFTYANDTLIHSFNFTLPGEKDSTYDDYCCVVWKLLYKIYAIIWTINDEIKKNYDDFDKMFNEIFDIVLRVDNEKVQFLKDIRSNSDLFKRILKEQLDLEKQHNDSNDKIILYRGGSSKDDGIINKTNATKIHSISYNISQLNGVISDYKKDGACTIRYILDTNICNYYVLKKSDVEEILFIPPLHPLLQLLLAGEFFHVRTFIPKDYGNRDIKGFAREHNPPKYFITEYNTEKLDELFKEKIKGKEINFEKQVTINEHKYLKYKHKYLKLKNLKIPR